MQVRFVLFGLEENSSAFTHVVETILAADPEMAEVTYAFAGDGAALFKFDPSTGLTKTTEQLDYESPRDTDGDNAFGFVLSVPCASGAPRQSLKIIRRVFADGPSGPPLWACRVLDASESRPSGPCFPRRSAAGRGGRYWGPRPFPATARAGKA